jgi:hypothetical protein
MNHELFRMETFAAMEKHLSENPEKEFTLTGVDLTVLIFLTKSITLNELRRDMEAIGAAQEETKALIQRITERENAPKQPPGNLH